jgi:hypothetical protein
MFFGKKKPRFVLHLEQVDHFDCEEKHHVPTTYQYGSHPARVYAICPFCKKFAVLDWKDRRARWGNRVFYSVPLIWQASLAFLAISAVVYFLYLALR